MSMKLQTRLGHLQSAIVVRENARAALTGRPTVALLRTAGDILASLEEITVAVRIDPFVSTAEKARAVGHYQGMAARC